MIFTCEVNRGITLWSTRLSAEFSQFPDYCRNRRKIQAAEQPHKFRCTPFVYLLIFISSSLSARETLSCLPQSFFDQWYMSHLLSLDLHGNRLDFIKKICFTILFPKKCLNMMLWFAFQLNDNVCARVFSETHYVSSNFCRVIQK